MTQDTDLGTAAAAAAALGPEPFAGPTVVGIGASAGGLEALTALVANLPRHGGMSYVVAQHMSPQHKSMMVDLLARATALPVVEASEGQVLAPDRIYITPPNRNIEIRDGAVVLTGPYAEGPKPSVDLLFQSLAEDLGDRVVGVILSGTGSDGARGIQAIKRAGGVTVVQAPDSAKYGGMPEAALRTGRVDKVLSPERIGRELPLLAGHGWAVAGGGITAEAGSPADAEIEDGVDPDDFHHASGPYHSVISLIRQRTNVDFQQYKSGTIQRRIQRRLTANRLTRLEDYVDFLLQHPKEIERLCADILISVTSFFRDRAAFEALGQAVSEMLEHKPEREGLRVWVPGCATGEEAYSIGMVVTEELYKRGQIRPVQIFAVDIDEAALAIARRAVYPISAIEDLADDMLRKYLTRVDNVYQVDRQLRDMVVFSRQDITKDPPFSHIDIISCRNLLIYFNQELQQRILNLFAYALNPGGILFLGKSETLGTNTDGYFETVDGTHRVFVRAQGPRLPLNQLGGRAVEIGAGRTGPRPKPEAPALPVLVKMSIGEVFGPPCVVTDNNHRLLYIHGDVSPFVRLNRGKFDQDLLTLIAPDLRTTLRAVLHRAERSDRQPVSLTVKVPTDDETRTVRLSVHPLGTPSTDGAVSLRMIAFERLPDDQPGTAAAEASPDDPRVGELEHELTVTREHLQTVIQELESANEELQATNQELQSSNEELQATNEELETTNEELQSTNEELQTVNDELQAKSNELLEKATDLQNVSSGIEMPVIILDRDLRVRLFNESARALFEITQSDLGAQITQLASTIDLPDMRRKFQRVIETGVAYRADITDVGGRVYALTISPYRDSDKVIVGAVFTASNITDRVRAEASLREMTRQLNEAQRIAHVGSWRWDVASDTLTWSPELYRICGLDPDDMAVTPETALTVYHPDDRGRVRGALKAALDNRTGFGFEARVVRPGGDVRHVKVTGLCKLTAAGQPESIFGVVKDDTESINAAKLLTESHARLTSIMNTIIEGIVVIDPRGIIRLANTAISRMFGYAEPELVGQNISLLIAEPMLPDQEPATGNGAGGRRRLLGSGREVTGRRKDGTQFPIELSVGEVIDEIASGDPDNKQIYIGTMRDISARKRYEEALMLSKRDAEAASEAKSTFLAKMSHELRTPLNAILGFSEILKEQLFGPLHNDKYLRYLNDIHASGQHLLKLIDDILDISRIESGKFRIDEEIVTLPDLVRHCADQIRDVAARKAIAIELAVPEALPRLRADSRSVRQILVNLLDNAIKYTSDGGSVAIGAALMPDRGMSLTVSDTGRGMSQSAIDAAFQPFGHASTSRLTDTEGAGLGLFVAKSLAELHGGSLVIASDPGHGTEVTVRFPHHRVVRM